MTEGIILKGIGGFYYVDTPEGLIECKARGKFRKTVGKPIVGDRVQLEVQPDGTGYLMSIAPRRNSLIRPAVANLDLVVAVASAAPPVTDPFLIDKVTATSSSAIWSCWNNRCEAGSEKRTNANSPPWLNTPANCIRSELRRP